MQTSQAYVDLFFPDYFMLVDSNVKLWVNGQLYDKMSLTKNVQLHIPVPAGPVSLKAKMMLFSDTIQLYLNPGETAIVTLVYNRFWGTLSFVERRGAMPVANPTPATTAPMQNNNHISPAMKQYHYVNSAGQQAGPVDKFGLRMAGITRATLVWTPGMDAWTPAGQVADLNDLFTVASAPTQPLAPQVPNNVPPTLPGNQPQGNYNPGFGNQTQPNPGYQQPQYNGGFNNQPMGAGIIEKPQNYMVPSIIITILCCVPAGIVSIVYASKVDKKWAAGDVNGAMEDSKNARMWMIISAVLGFVAFIGAFLSALAG